MQMGWNEPGRDRDPWGGSNDVDEWFRRLRARFSHRGGGPHMRPKIWWLTPLVLVVVWILTGFFSVPSGSRAVVVRLGQVAGTAGPGVHWSWPWPVARQRIVNTSEQRSLSQRGLVLTSDGQLASAEFKVRYRVADPVRYTFGTESPSDVLAALAGGVLTRTARTETLAQLRSGTVSAPASASRLGARAAKLGLGVAVQSVAFTNIREPQAVTDARSRYRKRQRQHAAAAQSARHAAEARLAEAGKRGRDLIVSARREGSRRVAQARESVARFQAVVPAWRRDPKTTEEMLRNRAIQSVLTGAPKVVVSGPVHVVTIAAWPASGGVKVKAEGAASATAPAPATGGRS